MPPMTTVVGREPAPDATPRHLLAVADATLSRSHVGLLPAGDVLDVTDLGSRNGTWVDGAPVTGKTSVESGAVLRFGGCVCVAELDPGVHPAFDKATRAAPGTTAAARSMRAGLAAAAKDSRPVLITGETGVGKEAAAAEVHALSGRHGKLVYVNVTAIPEALFESELFGHVRGAFSGAVEARPGRIREADGGTLVLDEIGDLPLALQVKLLRVLESTVIRPVGGHMDHGVDVKFVATTNADLGARVGLGQFRQDLLARLRAHEVVVPPLRQRRADLMALCQAALPAPAAPSWASRWSPDVVELLARHDWPDNMREVVRVMYGLSATQVPATIAALPLYLTESVDARTTPGPQSSAAGDGVTRPPDSAAEFRQLLAAHRGNLGAAARAIGRDRKQIYRWIESFGVSQEELAAWRAQE
ncbi:MAG: sigma 54-interacting transcriptional regulator [Deltaproteobacteria bacterium]|nr:sigma 54-interacting transcriptional regulator [Deltaproteobacteria bacterium]